MGRKKKKNNNRFIDKEKQKKQEDKELFHKWLREHNEVPDKDSNTKDSGYKPFKKIDKKDILKKQKKAKKNKNTQKEIKPDKSNIKPNGNTKRGFSDEDAYLFYQWLGEEHDIVDKDQRKKKEDDKYKKPFSKDGKRLKKNIKPNYKSHKKFYIEDNDMLDKWLNKNEIIDKDSQIKDEEIYMYPPHLTDHIRIDSSLDLHGLKIEDALWQLKRYVKESFDRNDKIIKIIHGKGIHSTSGYSKLRKAVRDWIMHEGKAFIKFYKTATRKHGGQGAVILWLK